tara:strand:- start:2324 stop:3154 length:831 start_codon:yes stop_codon:yes gene_type:complete
MKIAVLLASHNRSQKTIKCIQTLNDQNSQLDFFLVDDNSSDDTVEKIKRLFPDVKIFNGSGNLYWAGAMRYGWNKIDHNKYDMLLVVNDDVYFYEDAITNAIKEFKEIFEVRGANDFALVGSTNFSNNKNSVSYGGQKRSSKWHPLKFKLISPSDSRNLEADTLNMNFAMIPTDLILKLGFLENYFVHGGADFEFGLRLKRKNAKIFVMKKFIGICDRNPDVTFAGNIFQRFRKFNDPKVQPFNQRYQYFKSYGGFLWPILFLASYIKLMFGLHKK